MRGDGAYTSIQNSAGMLLEAIPRWTTHISWFILDKLVHTNKKEIKSSSTN
jgi:hypothetical protein